MGRGIREMKKPIYEILSNDIETVEEMIDALMIAPKGYKLHPMGNKCALAVDHIHECVYVGMVIMRQFFMGCTARSNLQEKLRRNFLNWGIYTIMK